MEKLIVNALNYEVDDHPILQDLSVCIEEASFVGLLGPNGCGKSTLLKNIYRTLKPSSGTVFLDGNCISEYSNKAFARKIAVMGQENHIEFDMDVLDMVLLGRYAHTKLFSSISQKDREIALEALQEVGMLPYAERNFLSLSGGEKQRVIIARALAQQAEVLILDEPTNHLDICYQFQILDVLKKQKNRTILAALHDMNLAAMYCDRILMMHQGKIVCLGTPEEVLTKENIKQYFGVNAQIDVHNITNKIHISFLPNTN